MHITVIELLMSGIFCFSGVAILSVYICRFLKNWNKQDDETKGD